MKGLKKIFDFYLNASIHVALSVYAITQITAIKLHFSPVDSLNWFLFFGTIVSYNLIKYGLPTNQKLWGNSRYKKWIQILNFLSLISCIYLFCNLKPITCIGILILFFITVLYKLPLFPIQKSIRKFTHIKIWIVALVWATATVCIPLLELQIPIQFNLVSQFFQIYFLVLVLLIPFEIRDLKIDEPYLKTIPQIFGISGAKRFAYTLLLIIAVQESFFDSNIFLFLPIIAFTSIMIHYSTTNNHKYFTTFWVECIPIFWWMMLL